MSILCEKKSLMRWYTVIYAGFDVVDLTENGPDDVEGLDVAAAHVANLLANEPADSKFSFQKLASSFPSMWSLK